MNQSRTNLAVKLAGVLLSAFTFTLTVACSHSAKKDDTVHIDTANGAGAKTGSDGFVETAQAGDTGQTLFQRLGGMKVLTNFSNNFVDALAAAPQLTSNPKVAAGFRKDSARFKDQLAIQLCELSDGPCKYKGSNMNDAHADMNITPEQWRMMGKTFIKILRDVGVQKNERVELANRVSRFKPDIVTGTSTPLSGAALATKTARVKATTAAKASSVSDAKASAPSAAPGAAPAPAAGDEGDLPLPALDGQ